MSRDVLDEKIIVAIEVLWGSVLDIRSFSGRFTFFQSILLPKEYGDVIVGKAREMVPRISRPEFNQQVATLSSKVETARPFVGENIWALYSTYRAFALRQAWKVQDGLHNAKLYEWDKDVQGRPDKAIPQLLNAVFSKDELSRIIPDDGFGATASLVSALEFKLLTAMNEWVFNRKYQPIDLARQQTIQNITAVLGNMHVGGDVVGRDKSAAE